MFNWLEKMRKEPLSKRRVVAFGLTVLITGTLCVVWLSVLLPNFFHNQDTVVKNQSFETPKDTFFQNISTAWQGITSQYSQFKNTLQNVNFSDAVSSSTTYQSATSTGAVSVIRVSSDTPTTRP